MREYMTDDTMLDISASTFSVDSDSVVFIITLNVYIVATRKVKFQLLEDVQITACFFRRCESCTMETALICIFNWGRVGNAFEDQNQRLPI